MPMRVQHLIDVTIDDSPTSQAATWDFQGLTPKRVTLYIAVVESGSGASVTLTVEVSPDKGATLISYDKLLVGAADPLASVASVAYSATGADIISLSPEDVLDYIKVTMTGTSTTGSNKYAVDVYLVWSY